MAREFRLTGIHGLNFPDHLQEMTESIGTTLQCAVKFPLTTERGFLEAAAVSLDDEPIVFLRNPEGITLYNVAHGLCHLECELSGFPRNRTSPNARNVYLATQVLVAMASTIEHRTIYPRLIVLGFDPYQETAQIVSQNFITRFSEPYPFSDMPPRTRAIFLAAQYARIQLETPTGSIQATVEAWYRKEAPSEREVGCRLIRAIQSADPQNPKQARKSLIACNRQLGLLDAEYEVFSRFPKNASSPSVR